jgi:hypothetical protein
MSLVLDIVNVSNKKFNILWIKNIKIIEKIIILAIQNTIL